MNQDDLTDKLLNSPPENWPEAWRRLSLKKEKAPDSVRSAMRAKLGEELARKKESTRVSLLSRRSPWMAAAGLAAAACVLVAIWFFRMPGGDAYSVVHLRGLPQVEGKNAGKLQEDAKIQTGDRVILGPMDRMAFVSGNTMLFLSGPARIKIEDKKTIFVESGIISLRTKGPGEEIVWKTAEHTYRPTGTVASLQAGEKTERLSVLEGSFIIASPSGESVSIGAQKEALIESGRPPQITPLSEENRQQLQNARERMERIEKKLPLLDEDLRFSSEEEIIQHYGKIQDVLMKDGRSYRGILLEQGESVVIQTVFGIVRAQKGDVESVK